MGPGETMSLIAVVVLGIVVLGVMLEAYRHRLKFKERELELTASATAEKAAQYAAHTERLEARVRVLERIATAKGTDLAAQIEDLRDPALEHSKEVN